MKGVRLLFPIIRSQTETSAFRFLFDCGVCVKLYNPRQGSRVRGQRGGFPDSGATNDSLFSGMFGDFGGFQ